MLMVRQSDQGLPKGFPTLPSGSAEYSYYGTFRTSSKAPANQSTP
jgi:hypothetical protein